MPHDGSTRDVARQSSAFRRSDLLHGGELKPQGHDGQMEFPRGTHVDGSGVDGSGCANRTETVQLLVLYNISGVGHPEVEIDVWLRQPKEPNMKKTLLFSLCFIAVVGAFATTPVIVGSARAEVTFADGDFQPESWEIVIYFVDGNGGTVTATRETTGGNPGAFRKITTIVNDAPPYSTVMSFHHYLPAAYDPSMQGAILSIDYSEDAMMFQGGGDGQGAAAALRQDGLVYTGPRFGAVESTWTHHGWVGLRAVDFNRWPNAPAAHPDFSTNGSPIEVGFMRGNSTYSGGYTIAAGIDNWSFTIHPEGETPARGSSWGNVKRIYR